MSVTGVSNVSAISIQSLINMRKQLDDLQRQLGTGKKADTYAGLGTQSSVTVGLNAQLSALSSYDQTMNIVGTRLSVAQTALTQIDSIGQSGSQTALNSPFSLGGNGQTTDQQTAYSELDEVLGLLNTQSGNRYLFSGSAVDQPAVDSADHIINGNGAQAGFKQVLSERNQADLGSNGLGRLVISAPSSNSVSVGEDVAGSPFGFKLAAVNSTLTGATVGGPSGSPPSVTADFTGSNVKAGDTLTLTFDLPDGTTTDLTLTATTASPPGTNQFTIGATAAATAANFQTALTTSIGQLAGTTLSAASAEAAANDFFNVNAANPPQRVNGPPFDTATSLVDGTSANTVTWYTGEAGSGSARSTATAGIDPSISVSYGMRANEQALRTVVANLAVFASTTYSSSDPNAGAAYSNLTQRVAANIAGTPGQQKISDIEADLAGAQTAIKDSQSRHQTTESNLTDILQGIVSVPQEQVGAELLTLQTNLQASLQVTSMLLQTSLVKYLPAG